MTVEGSTAKGSGIIASFRRAGMTLLLCLLPLYFGSCTHYVAGNTYPVLFLHGFSATSATNCAEEFPDAKAYLAQHGWQGPVILVGYYGGDTGCDANLTAYQSRCAQEEAGNEGTNNEDMRHIACELDWYIWEKWGNQFANVDIVAHSMGGLIVRWMLATHDGSLPALTFVQDVVTVGTPHGGLTGLPCGCLQAQQMTPNSDFMQGLISSAQDPQSTIGTDWTMIGSDCDGSTAIDMDGGHKVRYIRPCYPHNNYLDDEEIGANAEVDECMGCPRNVVSTYSPAWPHSLQEVLLALSGPTW